MKSAIGLLSLLLLFAASGASADSGSATLKRIAKSGVIRLGYLENAAPFSRAEGSNPPAGYSIDLCTRVAADLRTQLKLPDLKLEWVKVTLQDRIQAVKDGRVDLECGTTTWTLSRQEGVDFSLMTFVDGGSMLVKPGAGLSRMADFTGKRIAVVTGTTTADALVRELKRLGLTAQIVGVSDKAKGMALLSAGEVDGYAADRLVLIGLALGGEGGQSYRLIDEDFSIEPYALALRRDDHDFRLAVNRALARIFRSGEIMKIYNTWLGQMGRPGVLLSALYVLQAVPE
jgi:ABC-type amino acid transport substrate-binding protein